MEYQITNFLDQIFSLDEQRQTECFVDFLKKYENELILVENLSMTRYLEKPYKIKMFFKILPYCKGLKKLAISDNFIEYKDADALFASLSTNIRLEELDVSDNQIFQNNTNTLIASLKKLIHGNRHEIPNNLELFLQNCQRLKVLKINNNNLGSRGIELLLKMISLMPQLEQLHVSKNKLTDQHIKMLSDSLIRLDNFKVLDISYNHISSEGAKHLSELLEKSPQLTSLNIENNDIGDLGIKEISKNISHNKKLTYLNIKANNISCQGFNLLGKKITSLKNLIKLNIASNELTNSVELFKTLASYQNLKYLELSNSGLNEVDVEELVKVFKKLINLETLYINDNNLGDKSIKKIVDVLINFLKIHHLNLVNTGMEQVGTNYMINNLRKFRSLKYLSFNPKYMNKITGELLIVEIMNCPELTSVFCKEHEEKGFILNLSVDKLPENYNNRKEIEKYINKISDNDIYKPTNTINIDKTTELHKKITILQDEVHLYKESKYWEKMLQASNKLLELDPRDDNKAGYYRYKGVALFKLRKKTEALAAYNMAMSYDIYSKKYVKEKAVILTQLQKYDEAKELFEDLHEDDLLLCTSYIEAKMRSSNTYLSENKVTQDILFRLKHSIQSYPLPQNIKKAATEELNSIESLNSDNYEKADKIAYLKNMLNLPWGKYTTQQIDYDDIISFLNKEHLGLQKVKKRMAESLVFVSDSEKPKLPIFCLVGAPGVGKTSIAHSIANAIGRKCVRMPLGGLDDPCIIRGFSRSYRSATPSKVLTLINQAGTWNPVMILDEIDKVAQRGREGDVVGSLLALLDPVQNSKFKDDYFDAEFDLSQVMFIATANNIENIPYPLRDRMTIIKLEGYSNSEKLDIAKNYLLPKILEEGAVKEKDFNITGDAIKYLIENYTKENGIRSLERILTELAQKYKVSQKIYKKCSLTCDIIDKWFGYKKLVFPKISKIPLKGVVHGLAYTEVGGDVIKIEARKIPGTGKIKATGKLGEVLKESIDTAYTCLISEMKESKLDVSNLKDYDIHIHIPEGAVPKEGTSAGIAIYSAIRSVLTEERVKQDVAMTGEITLYGDVLPVGGLKEKLAAALRSGIKTVIIPERNANDLIEIPEDLKKNLKIITIAHCEGSILLYKQTTKRQ